MASYPRVEFVASIGTWDFAGEAWVDTGFDGGLVIPASMRRDIVADADMKPVRLADGSVVVAPHWSGTLDLEGRRFRMEIVGLGARYLLGREVLDRLEICFEFGRRIRIHFADETGS